jgi:hypothetical protein
MPYNTTAGHTTLYGQKLIGYLLFIVGLAKS